MSMFLNKPIEAKCPGCGGPISITMQSALEGGSLVCPSCNRTINLKADPSVQESIDSVDRGLEELRRSIERLNG